MGAKGLFLLGAVAFWLPEIVWYAWTRQALNACLKSSGLRAHGQIGTWAALRPRPKLSLAAEVDWA